MVAQIDQEVDEIETIAIDPDALMADAFGLAGIILAPSISAIGQILWSRTVSRRTISGAGSQISDLKEREVRIRETVKAMDGPPLA